VTVEIAAMSQARAVDVDDLLKWFPLKNAFTVTAASSVVDGGAVVGLPLKSLLDRFEPDVEREVRRLSPRSSTPRRCPRPAARSTGVREGLA